jgi:hypothetical protein
VRFRARACDSRRARAPREWAEEPAGEGPIFAAGHARHGVGVQRARGEFADRPFGLLTRQRLRSDDPDSSHRARAEGIPTAACSRSVRATAPDSITTRATVGREPRHLRPGLRRSGSGRGRAHESRNVRRPAEGSRARLEVCRQPQPRAPVPTRRRNGANLSLGRGAACTTGRAGRLVCGWFLCITVWMGEEVEPHAYRVGSPMASIVGIAERTLQRPDLDEEARVNLRAIRDLALAALEAEEPRGDGAPAS